MLQINLDVYPATYINYTADDEVIVVDVKAEREALKRERRLTVKERDLDRRSKRRDKRRHAY